MWPMDADDLRSLFKVLTYGTPATRRALAERVAVDPHPDMSLVLVATVRSSAPRELKDRCLEVLQVMAAAGDPTASEFLDELNLPV